MADMHLLYGCANGQKLTEDNEHFDEISIIGTEEKQFE
jgi:hypothetical protein